MINVVRQFSFKSQHYLYSLTGVVLIFVGLKMVFDRAFVIEVAPRLQDFVTLSLSVFIEAFPFLVLGSFLAAAVGVYVPPDFFQRRLPKHAFLRRATLSTMGFLFPVCECGNVPLSRSLLMQGLKPSEAITFLLAAPVLNPITIWSTWTAFSNDMSVVISRVLATIIIANLIGFILSRRQPESTFITKKFAAVCHAHKKAKQIHGSRSKLHDLSEAFTHEALTMLQMLAFGAIIAGAVQSFVPREALVSIGSNVVLSIVAMLALAFVVSICANVDAFFALSFSSTFTVGSLVAFLIFGPMIDIKMLALLKPTFKTELLVTVTVLALLLSGLAGLVVTYAF